MLAAVASSPRSPSRPTTGPATTAVDATPAAGDATTGTAAPSSESADPTTGTGSTNDAPGLGGLLARFAGEPTARILVPAIVGGLVLRSRLGRLRAPDVAAVAALVGAESATEWVLHRHLLHRRSVTFGGRTIALHPGEAHARHHQRPDDPTTVPIGPVGISVALAGVAAVSVPPGPAHPVRVTTGVTALALLLTYEWTHFLIHSEHRPRRPRFDRVRRAHLAHHHDDAGTWYGITGHGFDRLVGTAPPLPTSR